MRDISQFIVHCSATSPNLDVGVNEIREWHKDNGWSDIGYHYVIRRNGNIEEGRPLSKVGAHAKGFNRESIGICLIGGVTESNKPDANYTLNQYLALTELLGDLDKQYPNCLLLGHRDLPGVTKACPCFDVQSFRGRD